MEIERVFSQMKKPEEYLAPEEHLTWNKAVREVLLGMNDGLVTTLSFVAGVSGIIADNNIILLTGFLGMLAGAISMFCGAYLSIKSQREFFDKEIEREEKEVDEVPEVERDELRTIYQRKGFQGEDLERIVAHLTSDKERWVRSMMEEELRLFPEHFEKPLAIASLIGSSYIGGAVIPLSPYLFLINPSALQAAIMISAAVLFGVGAGKAQFTRRHWLSSGLEITGIGLAASAACYLIGRASGTLLPL